MEKRAAPGVEIVFVETANDPDPADSTYEAVFVYLIRRGERLEVETDRHLWGIFPRDSWWELLHEVGFEAREARPAHPEAGEEDVPWFVGVKPH